MGMVGPLSTPDILYPGPRGDKVSTKYSFIVLSTKYQLSLKILRCTKKSPFISCAHSLIRFYPVKMQLCMILVQELHDSIVFVVCNFFLLQASISSALVLLLPMGILVLAALLYYVKLFRHINKKVTRHYAKKIKY